MEVIKPYEKYKDSGIEWLDKVPEHWEVRRLGQIANVRRGSFPQPYGLPEWYDDLNGFPFIQVFDVGNNMKVKDKTQRKISEKAIEKSVIVKKGTLILTIQGSIGRLAITHYDACIDRTLLIFQSYNLPTNIDYLKNIISILFEFEEKKAVGSTIKTINKEKLSRFYLTIPPLIEQTAIANFLDYKIAKIDRFIFKKKQLIKLLNEQKAAIINDAVTKGLNPNAKMKPSGIEWLGDIPEHWDLVKLKYLCKITTGNKNTEDKVENGLYDFFVRSQKIAKINSYSFEGEGILTAGDGVGVGKVFHYINGKCDYHQRVYLFYEFFKNISAKYLFYFLQKFLKNELMIYNAKSTVDSVRLPVLKDFLVTVPQFSEQLQIVAHIEKETAILSKTIATIEKEIALVQEYRTALIAEAVTGKIDVREYNVPSFEEDKEYVELEEEMGLVAEEEINLD